MPTPSLISTINAVREACGGELPDAPGIVHIYDAPFEIMVFKVGKRMWQFLGRVSLEEAAKTGCDYYGVHKNGQ